MSSPIRSLSYAPSFTSDHLSALLSSLTSSFSGDKSKSTLPWVPRPLKYLALLVFLVNVKSWPFLWHVRVFRPVIYVRIQYHLIQLRLFLLKLLSRLNPLRLLSASPSPSRSLTYKPTALDTYLTSLSPLGASPFSSSPTLLPDIHYVYKTRATPDDCDYNFHLSNSSYAKSCDVARLGFVMRSNAEFFRDGGWMPLAATSYTFGREIRMWEEYEVRMYIAGWDGKWLYTIAKFVSRDTRGRNKNRNKSKQEKASAQVTNADTNASSSGEPALSRVDAALRADAPSVNLHTPEGLSVLPTPSSTPGRSTPLPQDTSNANSSNTNTHTTTQSPPPPLWPEDLSKGETLHCVAVSQMCYKLGRVTVPPRLVLAGAGVGLEHVARAVREARGVLGEKESEEEAVEATWEMVQGMRRKVSGKRWTRMQEVMRGGWKDDEAEAGEGVTSSAPSTGKNPTSRSLPPKWWDIALEPYEEERKRRTAIVERLVGKSSGGGGTGAMGL